MQKGLNMVLYGSDELIPASEFAKKFGSYLQKIKSKALDKVAVLKNNHIEAVLVSKEEYERMREALDRLEQRRISQSPEFEKNREMFQQIYLDVQKGREELIPYDEGQEELDRVIDDIENAHR